MLNPSLFVLGIKKLGGLGANVQIQAGELNKIAFLDMAGDEAGMPILIVRVDRYFWA